jgi:multidrug efflux pump
MNPSAPFIGRPVATTLLTIGIALAGILLQAAGLGAATDRLPHHCGPAAAPGTSPETADTVASLPNVFREGQCSLWSTKPGLKPLQDRCV